MGQFVFAYCTGLTNVAIGNGVSSLGPGAFLNCSSLTGIALPNSLTNIGDDAFQSCSALGNLAIPAGVTAIGLYSLYGCTSLTNVNLGAALASISDYAFGYCPALVSLYFSGSAPAVGESIFIYDSGITVYYLPGTAGWETMFAGMPTVQETVAPPVYLSAAGFRTNGFALTLFGASGSNYTVQISPDLVNWQPLTNFTAATPPIYFSDKTASKTSRRFYRVEIQSN
jgi:hypothetical protein